MICNHEYGWSEDFAGEYIYIQYIREIDRRRYLSPPQGKTAGLRIYSNAVEPGAAQCW